MTVMSLAEFDVVNIKIQFRPHLNRFNFQQIETPDVKKLLKEIDVKKVIVIDTIPPKLIKIIADSIAELLTQGTNCCLSQGIFPDNAGIVSVVPLSKGKPDQYDVLNYRPLNILSAVSKICKNAIGNQLMSYFNKDFPPVVSVYKKVTAFNRFLFVCQSNGERLDKNIIVAAVLMNLSKVFNCIPHNLIIAKFGAYETKRKNLRLIYYLKGRKQSVKINNTYSNYN